MCLAGDAFSREAVPVDGSGGRVLRDVLVPERLRICRLVALVVAVPTVPHQVDHEVVPEVRPIHHREPYHGEARLRVVRVHVHDRDSVPLRQVARVHRRAAIPRVGREADLVVDDDVDRAANGVSVEARHVQGLGDYAFRRKSGISVHEDRDHRVAVGLRVLAAALELSRAGHSGDHRVHELEMARVRGQPDQDGPDAIDLTLCARPVVVLHVARAGDVELSTLHGRALELCQ